MGDGRTEREAEKKEESQMDTDTRWKKRQRRAPCGWDDLADELVLHVASFLDMASVASLGCADHRTRQACLDDRLWKRFYRAHVVAGLSDPIAAGCAAQAAAHDDVVALARAWLADPTDLSRPLTAWNRVLAANLCQSNHYITDADIDDHRWACALHLTPAGRRLRFARYPDVPLHAVGVIHGIDIPPFTVSISRLALAPRKDPGVHVDYRGAMITDGDRVLPHGYGVAVATKAESGRVVVCKIVGEWERGLPNGRVRVWFVGYGGVDYYEGGCAGGRAHGRALYITPHGAYEGRWAGGFLCGPALVRHCGRHIVHAASSPGCRGGLLPAIVYRNDGLLAFKGLCDTAGMASRGLVFDRSGAIVCDSEVNSHYRISGGGTVHLGDGTTISGRFGTACPPLDLCVTYPNGDAVHCQRPGSVTAMGWIPATISRFTFSPTTADPALAGRSIDGPWHILAVGRRSLVAPAGHAFPREPREWAGRPPAMVVTHTDDRAPTTESGAGALDDNLAAVRALDEFVFWPRSAGSDEGRKIERERFLDHMAAHHGFHWSTCRVLAAATPW